MARKFGQVRVEFWSDEKIRGLTDTERLLAVFLIAGPHTNSLGCYRCPAEYLPIDLAWGQEKTAKAFASLIAKGIIAYCERTRFIWVRNFLRHNKPKTKNNSKGILSELAVIPKDMEFYRDLMRCVSEHLGDDMPQELSSNQDRTKMELSSNQDRTKMELSSEAEKLSSNLDATKIELSSNQDATKKKKKKKEKKKKKNIALENGEFLEPEIQSLDPGIEDKNSISSIDAFISSVENRLDGLVEPGRAVRRKAETLLPICILAFERAYETTNKTELFDRNPFAAVMYEIERERNVR